MPADFISNLYVFILAGFVGFELIKRVSPLLHTPLMSLTNALDAIVVVAAIIISGRHETRLTTVLARLRWLLRSATWSADSSSPIACCACSSPATPKNHEPCSHFSSSSISPTLSRSFFYSVDQVAEFAGVRAPGVLVGEIAAALAVAPRFSTPN